MTRRTMLVSVLLLAAVTAVIGALAVAIDRQHGAAQRARRSLTVIAAANLTQQRLLAVQTNIRGYLIRGNEDLLIDYRSLARRCRTRPTTWRRWSRATRRRCAARSRSARTRSPTSTTTPIR